MANGKRSFSCLIAAALLLAVCSLNSAWAQVAPPMGTARSFAVLGASAVTNTGPSAVTGNLGVSPGTSITGFPPGTVTGTTHPGDATAAVAQADAATAYGFLAAETCTTNLTGMDLGGMTLLPGVYCFDTSAQLTGTLILNAAGNPNAVFVFQMASTLTTASGSAVIVTGGSPCNVFFQVGSSATLGTGTAFSGNIFALISVTETTGASVSGGSYALNGAVTMDTNAATACQGTLQVCKVAGSGVVPGTNFLFNVGGTPLTIPAGPAPVGSCSDALTVPSVPTMITETIPPGTDLASVTTLPGAGLLISSNLAAGTSTVAVNPGGQTIATFVDTIPPPPVTGFLQICKIAGSGVPLGTNFTFSVSGAPVTVAAGPPVAGTCSLPLTLPAGQVPIVETLPAGTAMTAVSTLPTAGLLTASNLAAGTATVTVIAATQTIVTFTDSVTPTTGSLQICKVAGPGIVEGTNFTFVVAGTPLTIPAGLAPAGLCSEALVEPAGPVNVAEILPVGVQLTDVNATPEGSLVSSDLPAGQATVTIAPGGQTVVTFQDARIPVSPNGFLQICKVAGAGVVPGTNFVFMVAGTPVTVPAGLAPGGACSAAFVEPAGPVTIAETLLSGTVLAAVTSLPNGTMLGSNLAAGAATVVVQNGGQTIVTFVDTIPAGPAAGFLQVCKVAGAGIAVGANFTFTVAGTPVTVAAGPAPGGTCSAPLLETAGPMTIIETLPAGTTLTSVNTLPGASLLSSNLAAGSATVTVNGGGETIATFLDTVIPIQPSTGFLQVCKVAGAGVMVGTPFTFTVGGIPVTVLAGPAPGGSCSAPVVMPVGAALIAETASPGTVLTSVTTLPSGLLVSNNLTAGTATVTVSAGAQTIATFVNAVVSDPLAVGLLKVCKIAGTGVTPGTRFSFAVGAASFVVPAGYCVRTGLFPVGTAVTITELSSPAAVASAISVLPADRQGTVDLTAQSVNATVGVGVTEVYFTNVSR